MNYYSDWLSIQGAAACRGILHTIVKGDTLYKLSRLYGVSLDAIFEANPNTTSTIWLSGRKSVFR